MRINMRVIFRVSFIKDLGFRFRVKIRVEVRVKGLGLGFEQKMLELRASVRGVRPKGLLC